MRYQQTLRVAALCATLTAAATARAQAPATPLDATNAQADDLTHRGVDLLKKHQWAEAEALFQQAWAMKHAYDIAGNLGLAEAGLGKWRDASEHIAFALQTFPANGKAAHRELLREKLAKVREELAALTIAVGTVGAEVLVDGRSVGTAPLGEPTFVEPGAHTIEARLAGYENARQGVDATKGTAQTVTLALVAAQQAPPVVTPVVRRPVWPAVVTGVVAVGGLAAGVGLVVAANGKSVEAASLRTTVGSGTACFGASAGSSSCQSLASALRAKSELSDAAFAGFLTGSALALTAAGLGIWAAVAPKADVRVTPTLGAGAGGVVMSGNW